MKTIALFFGHKKIFLAAFLIVFNLTVFTHAAEMSDLEKGKALAFDRTIGNCLACHAIDDGELPGNSGPPLLQMKARYPDRKVLRAQVWDATERNQNSVMPPYGKHQILTDQELDLVVDYIHSL